MNKAQRTNIGRIIKNFKQREDQSLVALLQDIQRCCGYIPGEALQQASTSLAVPLSKLFSVATFYNSFSLKPRGRNSVSICLGTACHVKHGDAIARNIALKLDLPVGGGTTSDMAFTTETVRCLGCCSMAPVVRVNGVIYGGVTRKNINSLLKTTKKDRRT